MRAMRSWNSCAAYIPRQPRSTGVARACKVLAALSESYERHPVYHPEAEELCRSFSGLIAHDQSASELGEAEELLQRTWDKHWRMIGVQRGSGFTPRSLDVAIAFVCAQALEQLRAMRGRPRGATQKTDASGTGGMASGRGRDVWCRRLMS